MQAVRDFFTDDGVDASAATTPPKKRKPVRLPVEPGSRAADAGGALGRDIARGGKQETRRPKAVPTGRTPEEDAEAMRGAARSFFEKRLAPRDASVTRPESDRRTAEAATLNATREEQTGRFSPDAWRGVAERERAKAAELRAAGDERGAERLDAQAYNAELLADNAETADTFGAHVASNFLGLVRDPYAEERRNIREIQEQGLVASPEEQTDLGLDPVASDRGFSASRDLLAPIVGQAVPTVLGGMAGRAAGMGIGAALEGAGAVRAGQAVSRVARTTLATDEAAGFLGRSATRAARGAVEGNVMGAAIDARLEQQAGGNPWDVGLMSLGLGAVAGAGLETIGGALKDVAMRGVVRPGLARWDSHLARMASQAEADLAAREGAPVVTPTNADGGVLATVQPDDAPPAQPAGPEWWTQTLAENPVLPGERAAGPEWWAQQQLPDAGAPAGAMPAPRSPLDDVLDATEAAGPRPMPAGAPAGPDWWAGQLDAQRQQPPAGPSWWDAQPPAPGELPSATRAGLDRAAAVEPPHTNLYGEPEVAPVDPIAGMLESVDVARQLRRQQQEQAAAQAAEAQARLDAAATQGRMGPRTLRDQLADPRLAALGVAGLAGGEEDEQQRMGLLGAAGTIAVLPASKKAVHNFIATSRAGNVHDGLALSGYQWEAEMQQAGVDRATAKAVVRAIRATEEQPDPNSSRTTPRFLTLDELEQLVDEQLVIPRIERGAGPMGQVAAGLQLLRDTDPDFDPAVKLDKADWESILGNYVADGNARDTLFERWDVLHSPDALLGIDDLVQLASAERVGEGAAVRSRFYSRMERAIEQLPKAFDQPRSPKEWMQKLRATTTFNAREYEKFLHPFLEEAAEQGMKVTRGDILDFLDEHGLKIEEVRLENDGKPARADEWVDADLDVDDIPDEALPAAVEQRRERIREIEQAREDELTTARTRHEGATERVNRYWQDVEQAVERSTSGIPEHAHADAIDVIQRAIDDYRSRYDDGEGVDGYEAAQHAISALIGEGHIERVTEPRLPPGYRTEQQEDGWYVFRDGETGSGLVGPHPTELEAMNAAELAGYVDLGGTDYIIQRGVSSAQTTAEEMVRAHLWGARDGEERYILVGPSGNHRFDGSTEEAAWAGLEYVIQPHETRDLFRIMTPAEQIERELRRYGYDADEEVFVLRDQFGSIFHHEHVANARDLDSFVGSYVEDRFEGVEPDVEHLQSEIAAWVNEANEADELWRRMDDLENGDTDPDYDRGREYEALTDTQDQLEGRLADWRRAQAALAQAGAGGVAALPARALPPVVKGGHRFSTYQRIPNGTNYRELVTVFRRPDHNMPGSIGSKQYDGGHWASASYGGDRLPDAAMHIRVEDHNVETWAEPQLVRADLDALREKLHEDEMNVAERHLNEWSELRAKRRKADERMREIGDQLAAFEAAGMTDGTATPEARTLASEYRQLQNDHSNYASREAFMENAFRLYYEKAGLPRPDARRTLVMVESQADSVQDANKKRDTGFGLARRKERRGWRENVKTTAGKELEAARDRSMTIAEQLVVEKSSRDDYMNGEFKDSRQRLISAMLFAEQHSPDDWPASVHSGGGVSMKQTIEAAEKVLEHVGPDHTGFDGVRAALADAMETTRQLTEWDERIDALDREQLAINDAAMGVRNSGGVPDLPWQETEQALAINTARFLLEAIDGDYESIAWSTAENRYDKAGLKLQAGRISYDQLTPKLVRKFLAAAGFKDVKIEHTRIKGYGHWRVELTPAMREGLKKLGFPLLSALMMVGAPSIAEAQDGTQRESSDWSLVGSGVVGAGLMYLAMNRKGRKLAKENRQLSRALMSDELTGLGNKTALHRAKASVDADPNHAWLVFDGDKFKAMNDAHGHAAGDEALQHFGKVMLEVAKELDVPMRGFRPGGDEFAFAVPKERAEEVLRAIEQRSTFSKGEGSRRVTTQLTGEYADTFDAADMKLTRFKEERRARDPKYRRSVATLPSGATVYSTPIGPAIRALMRYPSSLGVAAVGAIAASQEDEDVRRTGAPILALAALNAVGTRRLSAAGGKLGRKLVEQLKKTERGTAAVRATVPTALLPKGVERAIEEYEALVAKGDARATEVAGVARRAGPAVDRLASDVREGEEWEDVTQLSPEDVRVAAEIANRIAQEFDELGTVLDASGSLPSSAQLPGYLPRRYAHFDALDALSVRPKQSPTGPNDPKGGIRQRAWKRRTLDEPLREAQAAIEAAQQAGDVAAEMAAQARYDELYAEHLAKRVALGEIREASYRTDYGLRTGYRQAAAAKLHQALRAMPGVIEPEYADALDDFIAAKDALRKAKTRADRDQAQLVVDAAFAELKAITDRYKDRNEGEWRTLPDTKSMGVLRGAVVQQDVANELVGFTDKKAQSRFLNWWKKTKTAYNPGTHIGNIASNVTALHMAGVPAWRIPDLAARAALDIKRYGAATRALAEAGVLNQNVVTAGGEGAAQVPKLRGEEGLGELLETTRPETARVLEARGIRPLREQQRGETLRSAGKGAAIGAMVMADEEQPEDAALGAGLGAALGALGAGRRGRAIEQLYNNEDNVARVLAYQFAKRGGKSEAEAIAFARSALGDFRSRSPALNMVRGNLSPFILYPAKMLPTFAGHMIERPWRYLALVAMWGGVQEYAEARDGEIPESDEPLRNRRSLGYFFPGETQLPGVNERGERRTFDVSRWTPLSAVTTAAPPGSTSGALADRYPGILSASSPFIDAANRFVGNRDAFTGREILRRDYPQDENIARALREGGRILAPTAFGIHMPRIYEDVENRDTDKLVNDLGGPAGLRPRYVVPGANVRSSTWQLQQSLNAMKQDLERELLADKSDDPTRKARIVERYNRRIQSALHNYTRRVGSPPPQEILDELESGDSSVPSP